MSLSTGPVGTEGVARIRFTLGAVVGVGVAVAVGSTVGEGEAFSSVGDVVGFAVGLGIGEGVSVAVAKILSRFSSSTVAGMYRALVSAGAPILFMGEGEGIGD